MARWRVDPARSAMVGDKASDVAAAEAAGILGVLYRGEPLADIVAALISRRA
jgi:D-glycero-D-manno-heptose 1,7-bisphosphate phosphatase